MRNFQNKFLLGVIILSIFFVSGCFKKKDVSQPQVALTNQTMAKVQSQEKIINESGKVYEIKAKYPSFNLLTIDQTLENFIKLQIDEFKKNADVNSNYPPVTDSNATYDFTTEYQIFTNDKILGVKFEIYQYTGGAHGSTIIKTFNFDLAENKELALSDCFLPNSNYLKVISDYSAQKLKEILSQDGFVDAEWIAQGTKTKTDNFSAFTFNQAGLVIYFQQYQVAAYAAGIFDILIPYEKLNSILLPKYQNLIFN